MNDVDKIAFLPFFFLQNFFDTILDHVKNIFEKIEKSRP